MTVIDETLIEKPILTLNALAELVQKLKVGGDRVVHCHGVFDLLHVGHIKHLEKAKAMGDTLVVTLTPDRFVNKGPHRPAFHEGLRAEALAALQCVDYVAINEWPDAVQTIKLVQPDLYVKGSDYKDATKDKTGGITREREAVEAVGGEIVFTNEATFSSSKLINRHLPLFPKEMQRYLEDFATRYTPEMIHSWIDATRPLRVLLIGESIIDEYHYCRTMGKSGKEPVLAACFEKMERFAGGILAVANHVASFSDMPRLLTFLGKTDSQEAFIREQLNPKVHTDLIPMSSGPTIVKKRFLESYPLQKLFEVYIMESDETCPENSRNLLSHLEDALDEVDVVIAVDYGHGMFSKEVIDLLAAKAPFLAVNTQVNAGNQGFNTISKYPRADYICLSESEVRIDVRQRQHDLGEIIRNIAAKLDAKKILVTQGQQGLTCFDHKEGLYHIPAFTGHSVDRVGAGDAVLSVTSLLAKLDVPIEAIGLIGNAVGFQKVQHIGNRTAIDRVGLLKFLDHSLI